jgi:hypothetical protein
MFLVTRTFTRPNTSIAWHNNSGRTDFQQAWLGYVSSAKITNHTSSVSHDGLTLTIETTWADEAAWQDYLANPATVGMVTARNAYNSAHGITDTRTTKTV